MYVPTYVCKNKNRQIHMVSLLPRSNISKVERKKNDLLEVSKEICYVCKRRRTNEQIIRTDEEIIRTMLKTYVNKSTINKVVRNLRL